MSKRILTVIAIVLAVSGLTFANVANVTQLGTMNNATVQQYNPGNTVISQQNAATTNDLTVFQAAWSGPSTLLLTQIAQNGSNYAATSPPGGSQGAYWGVYQNRSYADLRQLANTDNTVAIDSSCGDLRGANSDGSINPGLRATQQSNDSRNDVLLQQTGGTSGPVNALGLDQRGDGYNWADVSQLAAGGPTSTAGVFQRNFNGFNWVQIRQDSDDSATVSQRTMNGINQATILQGPGSQSATVNQTTFAGNNWASISQP